MSWLLVRLFFGHQAELALRLLSWYGVHPPLRVWWPGGSPFSWWYG
jgi:hypothetical protein